MSQEHSHDECNCGCDHSQDGGCTPSDCASCGADCGSKPKTNADTNMITLTTDDGEEINCAILTVFPVAKKEYIALLPLDENGKNSDGEVYLFAFSRTENGDPILANIEDDAEYRLAADTFDIILTNAHAAEEANLPIE